MSILGTVKVCGADLQRKRCPDCEMVFVQAPNEERERCVDCDPPDDSENLVTIGRDSANRPNSEKNYHGGGYRD